MSDEELADFLFNTYDTERITFDIYTKDGEKHIWGKINFKEGVLGYRFDLITNGRTKEEIEEKDRLIDKDREEIMYYKMLLGENKRLN